MVCGGYPAKAGDECRFLFSQLGGVYVRLNPLRDRLPNRFPLLEVKAASSQRLNHHDLNHLSAARESLDK